MRRAKIHVEMVYCYNCPYCIEKLADYADSAFDYPDLRLFCKSARRDIITRVRHHEARTVEVPEWCPLLMKDCASKA